MLDPADVQACQQAVLDFTAAFDMGDADGMLRQFHEDGVWKRKDGDLAGRAALREFMRVRNPGITVRHVISNLRVRPLAPDRAAVDSYVTVFRHDASGAASLPAPLAGVDLVGRYRDELLRTPHGWQLHRREVSIDFKRT
jgi:hypothetical protein